MQPQWQHLGQLSLALDTVLLDFFLASCLNRPRLPGRPFVRSAVHPPFTTFGTVQLPPTGFHPVFTFERFAFASPGNRQHDSRTAVVHHLISSLEVLHRH